MSDNIQTTTGQTPPCLQHKIDKTNYGFVLVKDGWSLSSVYDVNPNIYGDTLSLNMDSDNNLINFNVALSVAKMTKIKSKGLRKAVPF